MKNNFVYKNIKIFQGGSTGLVQQKNLQYTVKQKPKNSILVHIKNACKNDFNCDIVAIHSGSYIEFVEEDADFMVKKFSWKNRGINFSQTGVPKNSKQIALLIRRFTNLNLTYCILEQTAVNDNFIERTITNSNIVESIGWTIQTPNTTTGKNLKTKTDRKTKDKTEIKKTKIVEHSPSVESEENNIQIGEHVMHEQYGRGSIIGYQKDKIEVNFEQYGIKKILYSFLDIERK
jgi:hypothetical protein